MRVVGPRSGWICPLSCGRNTLQATANQHQALPQPRSNYKHAFSYPTTASITYLLETTAETPPTPQIWLDSPTFMRTKYPSSDRKSTSSAPITPLQLQICNLIHPSTAWITYLHKTTAETPPTPQISLDSITFMRTKYPSNDSKSTPSAPTTPLQLQTCNLIHQSTAAITYLLESTAETPPTPQIWLDSPTFMRTNYPSSDRKSTQALPQPGFNYKYAISYTHLQHG